MNFQDIKQYFNFRFDRLSHFLCNKGSYTPTDPFTGVLINGKIYAVVKTFDNSYKYVGDDGKLYELPKDDTPYEFKNISGRHIKQYSRWYNTSNGAISIGFTDVVTNLQDLYSRKMRVLDSKNPDYPIGMEIAGIPAEWTELQSYFFLHEDLRTIMGKIDITNATLADMRKQDLEFYNDARDSYADMQYKLGKIDANTDDVEGKLDKIDANTDELESKLDKIDANTDDVEAKLDGIKDDTLSIKDNTDEVETKLDKIDTNTDELETKLDGIKEDTVSIKDNTDEVEVKLDKIDANTDDVEASLSGIKNDTTVIKDSTDEVEAKLEAINQNTDGVESALSGIKTDTEVIIQNTDDVEAKLDAVKGDTETIKVNTDEVESKLSNIENNTAKIEEPPVTE